MEIYKIAAQFIASHNEFFICGHTEPDGDCAGSQLVLASVLYRLGKKAYALQTGPFDRPETGRFASRFLSDAPEYLPLQDGAVIVCDCSTKDRIADTYHRLLSLPTMVIDHHASGEIFGNVRCVDDKAAATTLLVAELLHSMDIKITAGEAELLLFGLATDTGFFRHCEKDSGRVFRCTADLVDAGASPKEVYLEMFGNREYIHRKFLGLLLDRAEALFDGKLVFTYQTLDDIRYTASGGRSTDELYNLFQTVKNVEVVLFVREESNRICSVGLRSKRNIDVGAIAAANGGGGHKLAAGFNFEGDRKAVRALLVETFAPLLEG